MYRPLARFSRALPRVGRGYGAPADHARIERGRPCRPLRRRRGLGLSLPPGGTRAKTRRIARIEAARRGPARDRSQRLLPAGPRRVAQRHRHRAGRNPRRLVVVGAHYDTKDLPGYLGANDNASGVAVLRQLARTIRPRTAGPTIGLRLLRRRGNAARRARLADPAPGAPGQQGRGAGSFRQAEAMILLDLVGDPRLRPET